MSLEADLVAKEGEKQPARSSRPQSAHKESLIYLFGTGSFDQLQKAFQVAPADTVFPSPPFFQNEFTYTIKMKSSA